ncbi:histidinol-phosphate transaminase [Meridianimarinicoccus sp. MJW13]|uniref:histidinol-phosphate transaminase n=1 Tax=Meridianimarinicoccus sp. MJW13 TaxID=2720031 RepID=UPI001867F7AA|nr:histidinol-phosphate transaminase [Fluviibacterium sp. MJW13]
MTQQIVPQPGILEIAPYKGGADTVEGVADVVKLSSNENPFGPSPAAVKAAQEACVTAHRYPPGDHIELRRAIADKFGLEADRIICGAGSDEIISFLCQTYAGPGDEVLYSEHGFAMYKISALAAGASPVAAPERNRTTDVDALLAAVTDRTRILFVADPNNPTGTMVGGQGLRRLAESLPAHVLLVIDGAYAEFVDGFDGGAALVDQFDNVVMTRTFSKLYGLGGLRVGWGYGPDHVIDALNRVRGPFNVSQVQIKAAVAALDDDDHTAFSLSENTRLRAWLAAELAKLGVPSDPSFGNFILARFADANEALACNAALQAAGLIVRAVAGYGLPECLRITIGDEAACQRVVAAVAAFKDGSA